MRKKVFGRQFSRSRKAREALFKSLIKEFVLRGRIETTYAKAKSVQGDIDKLALLARKGGVTASRQISAFLSTDRRFVAKLVKEASSFKERSSGFTRIIRLPARKGDSAQMARIEWTEAIIEVPKKEKESKVTKVPKVPKAKKEVKPKKKVAKKK